MTKKPPQTDKYEPLDKHIANKPQQIERPPNVVDVNWLPYDKRAELAKKMQAEKPL